MEYALVAVVAVLAGIAVLVILRDERLAAGGRGGLRAVRHRRLAGAAEGADRRSWAAAVDHRSLRADRFPCGDGRVGVDCRHRDPVCGSPGVPEVPPGQAAGDALDAGGGGGAGDSAGLGPSRLRRGAAGCSGPGGLQSGRLLGVRGDLAGRPGHGGRASSAPGNAQDPPRPGHGRVAPGPARGGADGSRLRLDPGPVERQADVPRSCRALRGRSVCLHHVEDYAVVRENL